MKAEFLTGAPAEGAVVTAFTFVGQEYGGHPQPLTKVVVHLPAGVGGSNAGFPTCESATLQTVGPSACPPGSSAGPPGSVTAYVAFGHEIVEEQGTVQAYFGKSETLNFFVSGRSPVLLEAVMVGTLSAGPPPYGRSLDVAVPLITTVPGAPYVSISALTLEFGATRTERAGEVRSVTIPAACPPLGLDWVAEAGFSDGTIVVANYRSPCPRTVRPAPVLGQRQAVHVTAGTVTVRVPGSTVFAPLSTDAAIPNGSELDTAAGSVLVTAATLRPGHVQSAEAHGGRLLIRQDATRAAETHLVLSLPLSGCRGAGRAGAVASGTRRTRHGPKARHLWVSEHGGSWGTNGRYVSTSVEGTKWLTVDECNRSRVQVVAGKVKVHDLVNGRTRTLRAGEGYVAVSSGWPSAAVRSPQ
jgi:hypothetical protein